MERLTRAVRARGKSVVVYTKGKYEDTTVGEMEHKDIRNVMKHLSDYEDTGLTPAEIWELKERDAAKAARPISNRSLYGICLNCGQTIFKEYRFCPECGQKLKEDK